jgi:ribosomal protein L37E
MKGKSTGSIACRSCGHELATAETVCSACGATAGSPAPVAGDDPWAEWAAERNRVKTLWVVAVLAFWLTVAVQVGFFLFRRELDLILVSIAGGAMVLGMWLKTRLQFHQRREPPRTPSQGVPDEDG